MTVGNTVRLYEVSLAGATDVAAVDSLVDASYVPMRKALIVDDVIDTGLSLSEAARLVRDAGAAEVLTAVFARKPWPEPRAIEPRFVGWEAPARYLVGYGMDAAGALRGLPYVAALD